MKPRFVHVLVIFILLAALAISVIPAGAAPPNSVDHLRGRWDGAIQNLYSEDQPFRLLLDRSGPDPNDPQAALYNGCMAVGDGADFAPVSARVVALGNEEFDLAIFGTVTGGGFVIKLTGLARTFGAGVTDDDAAGQWQTAEETGDWSAIHHDRRQVKCPAVEFDDGLFFGGDVYGIVGIAPEGEEGSQGTILESFTNIVSSAVRVNLPGGGTMIIPFFTDLFSPGVDFINTFRFLGDQGGLPVSGGTYTFTLLDAFGDPIPGATATDVWQSCEVDAPRNVSAALDATGLVLTWDAVAPVAGFDPSAAEPLGFYQIELGSLSGDGGFGAGGIHLTSHLIPFAGFGGYALGFPDGENYGNSLLELPDGSYVIDTITFAQAVHAGGVGLECQVRAWEEQVRFEKSGGTITLLP